MTCSSKVQAAMVNRCVTLLILRSAVSTSNNIWALLSFVYSKVASTFVIDLSCFFEPSNILWQVAHQIDGTIKVNGFNFERSIGTKIKSEQSSFHIPSPQVVQNKVAGLQYLINYMYFGSIHLLYLVRPTGIWGLLFCLSILIAHLPFPCLKG